VFPPVLQAAAHSRCTHGAVIYQLESMSPNSFMLSVDDDTGFIHDVCICVLWRDFSKKKMSKNRIKSPKKNQLRAHSSPSSVWP